MEKDHGNGTFFIVGPGAQGTLIAKAIDSLGEKVRMLGRQGPIPFRKSLQEGTQHHMVDLPAATPAELASPNAIFVTVKAHELQSAMEQHLPQFVAPCPIIITSNGYLEELLATLSARYPRFLWRLGLSTCGVSQVSEDRYLLAGRGLVIWGPFSGSSVVSQAENRLLESSSTSFSWEPFPRPYCRRKWLFNVVVNSLSAAHRLVHNGDLLSRKKELREIFTEAFELGKRLFRSWPWEENELYDAMVSLIEATSQNENSMARDVRLGRPTESDFLAGLATRYPGFEKLKALHDKLRPDILKPKGH